MFKESLLHIFKRQKSTFDFSFLPSQQKLSQMHLKPDQYIESQTHMKINIHQPLQIHLLTEQTHSYRLAHYSKLHQSRKAKATPMLNFTLTTNSNPNSLAKSNVEEEFNPSAIIHAATEKFTSLLPLTSLFFDYTPSEETIHLLAGKLLLREELPFTDQQLYKLQRQRCLQLIPSFSTNPRQCRRCGNRNPALFADLPCARCQTTHVYCRSCIEMGRVMQCSALYYWTGPKPKYDRPKEICAWQGELTVAQTKAAKQITQAIEQTNTELLCWAVCGAGKTEMLFPGITSAIKQGKRICLATPRADVVRELLPRFQQAFPNTSIIALYGGVEKTSGPSQLVLSTTHQLLRFARAFDVMIIDEIDAFPYHADPMLPYVTNRAVVEHATTIYLTATPRQALQRQVANHTLSTVFVPIRYHGRPLPVPKPMLAFSLTKSLSKHKLPYSFWRWYRQRTNPTRQLLLFVSTIEFAEQLAKSMKKQLPTETITSVHAADPKREEKIQQFRHKQLSILLTTTILERGVTFPSVDVVVIDAGHAVFDQAALVQMAGRAGRSPDDPTGEVVFLHDGKTNAMLDAIRMIKDMNRKGREG